jgi:hypothetical protein
MLQLVHHLHFSCQYKWAQDLGEHYIAKWKHIVEEWMYTFDFETKNLSQPLTWVHNQLLGWRTCHQKKKS